jgi:DNA-binding MarR family transcriptional regulator
VGDTAPAARVDGTASADASADMNSVAFGTKRAFHGFLRVTRKALASVGLTAARFDLMQPLLAERGDRAYSLRQSELRRVLGVTAGVVSRMLRALEALGLVERTRGYDRRQRDVTLTARGMDCMRRARRLLLRGVQRMVWDAICFGRSRDSWQRIVHMDTLESYLDVLRRHFGDTARLYYPWGHPDD